MNRIYFGLILLLITSCILASCNLRAGGNDAPVEFTQNKIVPVSASDLSNELRFDNQDTAQTAYTNMLHHFGWDYGAAGIDKMPGDYGGCYINDRNVLTLCIILPDEKSIAEYIEACREPVEIIEVSYTLKELYQASDTVLQLMEDGKLEVYAVGADERNNCVPITLPDDKTADAARQLLADYPCVQISVADSSLTLSSYGEDPSDNDVIIVPEYPVYDPSISGIQFVIYNNGTKNLMFGDGDYEVEVNLNGQWYTIPFKPGVCFTALGYGIPPQTHRYRGVGLSILNYRFSAGKYRLVQKLNDHLYFSEFELAESKITDDTPYGFLALVIHFPLPGVFGTFTR